MRGSPVDEGRKRVPATVAAISDAVRWAEEIMNEIDRRHPVKSVQQQTLR
jgi:hypothetical protein